MSDTDSNDKSWKRPANMELLDFPVEILEQIAIFIELPLDLTRLALVNKLFSNIVRPHFSQFLTFGIPSTGGGWRVQSQLDKITERRLRNVRHIEVIHSSKVNKWGSCDIRVSFPDGKEYEEVKKINNQQEVERIYGPFEDPEIAPTVFNNGVAEIIRSLKPGQLQSFRFNRHSYSRVFYGVEVDRQILSALTSPQTRLTKLTLAFDPCLGYDDCNVFNFPHLRYFNYNCYDVSGRYHRVFSLLSSCQDTLEELHTANWKPQNRGLEMDDRQSRIAIGFDAWEECSKCAKTCKWNEQPNGKRIHLKNLKRWNCSGYSSYTYDLVKIFQKKQILENVALRKYSESTSISFSNYSSKLGVDWEKYFSYPEFSGSPASNEELNHFLETTTGFEKVTVAGVPGMKSLWGWVEGLKKGHRESLRKLKVVSWALHTDEEDVEYIGNSLPNLEELTVEMKESIWTEFMPDCIFDESIFPKLEVFKSIGVPSRKENTFREKLCQKVLSSVLEGKLPPNLKKIYVGKANYIFIIDRETAVHGIGEVIKRSEIEDMVFEDRMTVDEALEIYGIKVTEIKNQNRRTVWQGRKEAYE
ncbi:hypothetical protein TWF106_002193 [Orbilia oligospora]|uniref:F-box domain-containing protein n=1 Tax=Orbilia oligospora TaxID=2813651 RepID=A0A7C8UUM1_ORBOL|nr:hypothetical protein TWF679_010938 [Orbilia oligospora]KAF3224517.1 hypothetical protein TWF191_005985 [Orbilia oligospora]KAF3225677.1 hypothetical protein TWF106_002193 [Orbilia oligospora]